MTFRNKKGSADSTSARTKEKMNSKTQSAIFCLPMETKVRDLDARLYLGLRALAKGYSALVGNKGGVHEAMTVLNRQLVYFDKGLATSNDSFYRSLKQQGDILVSLAEEGGVYAADYKWVAVSYDTPQLEFVDHICMWGPLQHEFFTRQRPDFPKSKVTTTGHPRFDMRKRSFHGYYSKLNTEPKKYTPYILINSAFGTTNNVVPYGELHRQYKEFFKDTPYPDTGNLDPYYEYESKLFPFFTDAVRQAASAFPTINFIYRPHPIEGTKVYEEAFAGFNNIQIRKDGSVQEWIVYASLVAHHDCTTSIEALFSGVRAVSLAPVVDMVLAKEVPLLISDRCISVDDFLRHVEQACIQQIPFTPEEQTARLQHVQKIIANIDFDSSDVILNALSPLTDRAAPPKSIPLARRIRWALTMHINALFRRYSAPDHKMPRLSKRELRLRIRLLRETDSSLPEVMIKRMGAGTYLLSPKKASA